MRARTLPHSFMLTAAALGVLIAMGCHASDILKVPQPVGVVTAGQINTASLAEEAFFSGRTQMFNGLGADGSLIEETEYLTDEFTFTAMTSPAVGAVDARSTTAHGGYSEPGDYPLEAVVGARSNLLAAIGPLLTYATGTQRAEIGYSYALIGYAEVFMAEDYCAGVPLTQLYLTGGFTYGKPMTTDSLLGEAAVHFDSALAEANGSDSVTAMASIGLGRALLDRGQYQAAAAATAQVPTGFAFAVSGAATWSDTYQPTLYQGVVAAGGCGDFNISDGEGHNGLHFVSDSDPRLQVSTQVAQLCNSYLQIPDSIMYYPLKFGPGSTNIPIATGIEARLIEAEAALQSGNPSVWASILSALRADSADTHVTFSAAQIAIPADSTTGATDSSRVDFMFRERAFWLFGTGSRLGDLRRLVRQYHRGSEEVYPTGTYAQYADPILQPYYPSPLQNYGTDVDLTLPTAASGNVTQNPYYQGCTTPTNTA